MMRKAKNTGVTGGRSLAGTEVRGSKVPSRLWVRITLPSFGMATSKSLRSSFSFGSAKTTSGTPSPSLVSCQCASIAAIFIGWCLSVFRPCMSPTKICTGTVSAANPTAAISMRRPASTCVPFRRYHAPTPPITKQVVMNEPSAMCASRYGNEGLNTTCHQSTGCTTPLTIS